MDDERYGIDKKFAHPRALELIPDEFFWNGLDELAPFGSDEGDMALAEFRDWRKDRPRSTLEKCLKWVIESVGEINVKHYDDSIYNEVTVQKQRNDPDFDDQQYIYTLDVSVISTAFGQLVDEGKIDAAAKPYVERALKRQIVWTGLLKNYQYADQYIANLQRLEEVLHQA
ncbi:MAG: hypothetical protein ACRCYY_16780 [Trueperaceae bacterium]